MNKHLQRVLAALKPKAASFGFTEDELKNAANIIAGGLNLKDDATNDEIDAAVNAQIAAALPMLALAQSAANRVINANKQKDPPTHPTADPPSKEPEPADAVMRLLTAINERLDKTDAAIANLGAQRVNDSRLARLNKAIEGTGAFADLTRSSYERQTFKDDADFDAFLESVTSTALQFKQGEDSTRSLTQPPAIPANWKGGTVTENEVTEIANYLH